MRVYLDHAASSPLRPEAAEAVRRALTTTGNPASVHAYGRAARAMVDDAREAVAALVRAKASQVVFTSGGTEAVALALAGLAPSRGLWLASAVEHQCVLSSGFAVETIPVDADGIVLLEALKTRLARTPRPDGVAIMLANNETGARQPVAEAAALARAAGCASVCDAVHGAGKEQLDLAALGVDAAAVSAHKFGGPQGVGALVVAMPDALLPLMPGGGQERGKRGGTPNTPGIAGFGAAAHAALQQAEEERRRIQALQTLLEEGVRRMVPQATIWAAQAERVPGTSNLWLPGADRQRQVMSLDLAGIAVSAGAACSSGTTAPSHVLAAMGATSSQTAESIRVSLGWNSAKGDVDAFLSAWGAMADRVSA